MFTVTALVFTACGDQAPRVKDRDTPTVAEPSGGPTFAVDSELSRPVGAERDRKPQNQCIQERERQIGGPATPPDPQSPPRRQRFPEGH
jgi:hypothetical protein